MCGTAPVLLRGRSSATPVPDWYRFCTESVLRFHIMSASSNADVALGKLEHRFQGVEPTSVNGKATSECSRTHASGAVHGTVPYVRTTYVRC
jgi:hypothetical protein